MNRHHRFRYVVSCLLPIALIAHAAVSAYGADRKSKPQHQYWALFQDGTVHEGRKLREWHHDNGKPKLDGHRLFDEQNPLRILRDVSLRERLEPPYVRLANGDVLPGQLVTGAAADPGDGVPAHVTLRIDLPMSVPGNPATYYVRIRSEYVVQAVWHGDEIRPLKPGTLFLTGGRQVELRAIRYRADGVRALTDGGSLSIPLSDVIEVHTPISQVMDKTAAVLADSLRPDGSAPAEADEETSTDESTNNSTNNLVARITTDTGAHLTYARSMLRHSSSDSHGQCHIVQPVWSLEPIVVPMESIVTRTYCRRNELPLSLMPAKTLVARSYLGEETTWRRDRNVRGGLLALDGLSSNMGIGTRSDSELAFDLTPGAERFTCWVGIDRSVGIGGCVQCRLFRDAVGGRPLWQSDFLRGGQQPTKVDVDRLQGARRLILVTDYGHDGRPRGADPLDIRDETSWLLPLVEVNLKKLR